MNDTAWSEFRTDDSDGEFIGAYLWPFCLPNHGVRFESNVMWPQCVLFLSNRNIAVEEDRVLL